MLPSKEQSYRIQVLRGLAIIAVVFIHNTPLGLYQVWCRPFLNFAVGTFLFLSGMLSSAERWNPIKRITKVAIPYIIWTLVYVVMRNIKSPVSIPIAYLKGLVAGNSSAIMYYIFVYSELTLLIPLIDGLARSRHMWLGFLISPLAIACCRTLPLVMDVDPDPYFLVVRNLSCLGWFAYFYLGYLLGNGLLTIIIPTSKLLAFGGGCIALQVLEGYWYLSMGEVNCGTQLKLTAIATGIVCVLIFYNYILADKVPELGFLHLLGDHSFGIYFSHLAIQSVLGHIPLYSQYVMYPLNAMAVVFLSLAFVLAGHRVLGSYAKYFALA